MKIVKEVMNIIKISTLHATNKSFTKKYKEVTTLIDNISINTELDVESLNRQLKNVNNELDSISMIIKNELRVKLNV